MKSVFDEIREEGIQLGHKEGHKEGLSEGISFVAAAMKAKGMSAAEIGELTKLSKEQIEAL